MITHFEKMKTGGNRGISKAEMEILSAFHLEDNDMSWSDDAYCKGSVVDFFPEVGFNGKVVPAMAMCEACPVREKCLNFAVVNNIQWGIWGGKTAANRRSMKRYNYARNGHEPRLPLNSVII